jgi:hypothetical protein
MLVPLFDEIVSATQDIDVNDDDYEWWTYKQAF